MRIISGVQARNFQGHSFNQNLSGADLFVGDNRSGKSTRVRALQVGLGGPAGSPGGNTSRPYLGPEPKGTVTLYGAGSMVARDLAEGPGTNKTKAANAKAEALFGRSPVDFDLADFASATDSARAKILKAAANAAGGAGAWNQEKLTTWFRKELGLPAKPAKVPEGHPLLELWKDHPLKGQPVGEWLEAAQKWADAAFTKANAAKTQSEAAAKSGEGDGEDVPPGFRADHEAEVSRLEKEIQELNEALSTLTATTSLSAAHAREGQGLTDALIRAEQAQEAARLKKEAAEAAMAIVSQSLEEKQAAVATLQASLSEASTAWKDTEDWVAGERLVVERTAAQRSSAVGAVATLQALAQSMDGACRHCSGEDPLGMGEKLEAALLLQEEADAAAQVAHQNLQIALGAAKSQTEQCSAVETALQAARNEAVMAGGEARIKTMALDQAVAALAQSQKTMVEATDALAAWQARQEESAGSTSLFGDADSLTAQRDGFQSALAVAKAQVLEHVRVEEREKMRLQRVAAREESATTWRLTKDLKTALVALAALLAQEAYRPLEVAANAFLAEAKADLEIKFHSEADFGASSGAIGYRNFWCLSDSSRALMGAALSVAFARIHQSPWPAVILDRLESISETYLHGVLTALAAGATRGDYQFVGALVCVDPDLAPQIPGLKVHFLTPPETEVGADVAAAEAEELGT